ncbi:hypothetical protein B0H15DRAFT_934145 [Mycena belliarum]|uniref:Uncharacterized protein n=1 Tax=Mycena belliarum TaxID=1033014 RepID=A0AAD6XIE9_9AGAR|nr:hypothetical protein B0H15DRAFT_934145 [Mycena belliae]
MLGENQIPALWCHQALRYRHWLSALWLLTVSASIHRRSSVIGPNQMGGRSAPDVNGEPSGIVRPSPPASSTQRQRPGDVRPPGFHPPESAWHIQLYRQDPQELWSDFKYTFGRGTDPCQVERGSIQDRGTIRAIMLDRITSYWKGRFYSPVLHAVTAHGAMNSESTNCHFMNDEGPQGSTRSPTAQNTTQFSWAWINSRTLFSVFTDTTQHIIMHHGSLQAASYCVITAFAGHSEEGSEIPAER